MVGGKNTSPPRISPIAVPSTCKKRGRRPPNKTNRLFVLRGRRPHVLQLVVVTVSGQPSEPIRRRQKTFKRGLSKDEVGRRRWWYGGEARSLPNKVRGEPLDRIGACRFGQYSCYSSFFCIIIVTQSAERNHNMSVVANPNDLLSYSSSPYSMSLG
jgi:hypothetical protein